MTTKQNGINSEKNNVTYIIKCNYEFLFLVFNTSYNIVSWALSSLYIITFFWCQPDSKLPIMKFLLVLGNTCQSYSRFYFFKGLSFDAIIKTTSGNIAKGLNFHIPETFNAVFGEI